MKGAELGEGREGCLAGWGRGTVVSYCLSSNSISLLGQELPPDLRSPQETPPSEEDSAEAERLKTEGEERPTTWPPGAAGSRSQPVRRNRWRASLGVGVRGFYMDVEK